MMGMLGCVGGRLYARLAEHLCTTKTNERCSFGEVRQACVPSLPISLTVVTVPSRRADIGLSIRQFEPAGSPPGRRESSLAV